LEGTCARAAQRDAAAGAALSRRQRCCVHSTQARAGGGGGGGGGGGRGCGGQPPPARAPPPPPPPPRPSFPAWAHHEDAVAAGLPLVRAVAAAQQALEAVGARRQRQRAAPHVALAPREARRDLGQPVAQLDRGAADAPLLAQARVVAVQLKLDLRRVTAAGSRGVKGGGGQGGGASVQLQAAQPPCTHPSWRVCRAPPRRARTPGHRSSPLGRRERRRCSCARACGAPAPPCDAATPPRARPRQTPCCV
jgi:hypothetical protein